MRTNNELADMFGDYWNNYLTVSRWAYDNNLKMTDARRILKRGRELWDKRADMIKEARK